MIAADDYDADDILREAMDFPDDDGVFDEEIPVEDLDFDDPLKADLTPLVDDDTTGDDLV